MRKQCKIINIQFEERTELFPFFSNLSVKVITRVHKAKDTQ